MGIPQTRRETLTHPERFNWLWGAENPDFDSDFWNMTKVPGILKNLQNEADSPWELSELYSGMLAKERPRISENPADRRETWRMMTRSSEIRQHVHESWKNLDVTVQEQREHLEESLVS